MRTLLEQELELTIERAREIGAHEAVKILQRHLDGLRKSKKLRSNILLASGYRGVTPEEEDQVRDEAGKKMANDLAQASGFWDESLRAPKGRIDPSAWGVLYQSPVATRLTAGDTLKRTTGWRLRLELFTLRVNTLVVRRTVRSSRRGLLSDDEGPWIQQISAWKQKSSWLLPGGSFLHSLWDTSAHSGLQSAAHLGSSKL